MHLLSDVLRQAHCGQHQTRLADNDNLQLASSQDALGCPTGERMGLLQVYLGSLSRPRRHRFWLNWPPCSIHSVMEPTNVARSSKWSVLSMVDDSVTEDAG